MTTIVELRPGVSFEEQAAASWARMETEHGGPLDVNRSTVPRAVQMSMYLAWQAYVAGRGPRPTHGRALHPDNSWHCAPIARASDTDDDEWIRAHPDYGWRFIVSDERWHGQYYPDLDLHRNDPAPPIKEDDDMSLPGLFIIHGNRSDSADPRNGVWLIANGKLTPQTQGSIDFLNSWSTTDGKSLASNFKTFATDGNPGAFDDLCRTLVLDFPRGDPTGWLTPQQISIAVIDELARRLQRT